MGKGQGYPQLAATHVYAQALAIHSSRASVVPGSHHTHLFQSVCISIGLEYEAGRVGGGEEVRVVSARAAAHGW